MAEIEEVSDVMKMPFLSLFIAADDGYKQAYQIWPIKSEGYKINNFE